MAQKSDWGRRIWLRNECMQSRSMGSFCSLSLLRPPAYSSQAMGVLGCINTHSSMQGRSVLTRGLRMIMERTHPSPLICLLKSDDINKHLMPRLDCLCMSQVSYRGLPPDRQKTELQSVLWLQNCTSLMISTHGGVNTFVMYSHEMLIISWMYKSLYFAIYSTKLFNPPVIVLIPKSCGKYI